MNVRVLGCAGTVSPDAKTSAFLVDGTLLLDGGTICSALSADDLLRIGTVFISHPHFDHIKGIPSLVETLNFLGVTTPVTIAGSSQAIDAISRHIMNDVIWPDFSVIPDPESPVVRYRTITEGETVTVDGISVTPRCLHGNRTDFGYLVSDGKSTLLYTSDIGPDARLDALPDLDAMIIEVSFPDDCGDLAIRTGHLTPSLLQALLRQWAVRPERIYVSHLKSHFRDLITSQLAALAMPGLVILNDGDLIRL
jgi:ribonuclease BN (tRNA processing enzyme)